MRIIQVKKGERIGNVFGYVKVASKDGYILGDIGEFTNLEGGGYGPFQERKGIWNSIQEIPADLLKGAEWDLVEGTRPWPRI